MHTIKFASTLFLLSDVLPHVALLSKRFQKETVSWYQIAGAVESTQDVLHAFKVSDGLYTESLIKELKLVSGLHELAVADAEKEEEEEETKVIESKVNHLWRMLIPRRRRMKMTTWTKKHCLRHGWT
jgi:hypothetical protein